MNKLEKELDSHSVDVLHEHFDYLNEHLKELRELDNKIQNIIQVEEEFDAKIQSAFGYDKISVLCSKFKVQIKNLSKNNPSVSSQATLNVQNDSFNNSIIGSSVNSNRNVNSVRLPKLQIDKYFGDPCLWLEFWNKFQDSIDKNETLTKVDKFLYLKSLLGVAGNVENGFALSDDNYDNALILLKEKFGREEVVVNAHMLKLLNLYPVKDSTNVIGLRKLYDICKIQIRSLESLNITSRMYGHLLQQILLKLLPEDLVLDFSRKQLGKKKRKAHSIGKYPPSELDNIPQAVQLENLVLADSPDCQEPITILIGADYYYDVVTGKIKHLSKKLVVVETIFSWCFEGRNSENQSLLALSVMVQENLISDQLKKFWDLEVSGLIDTKKRMYLSSFQWVDKMSTKLAWELNTGVFRVRLSS
ncbi:reverse transcriptase domain-containing protein [Trichonephila clavipes]|nr:reverse transcriptase domain-containing protein [Trichonephila clavipes]